MQRDSDTADSGKPRIVLILCEKQHEQIYSSTSTSLKNQM